MTACADQDTSKSGLAFLVETPLLSYVKQMFYKRGVLLRKNFEVCFVVAVILVL